MTCDFDVETNFVLNVITRCLEWGRLSPRPLFVRFVRARRRYPLFKRRGDPWRATTMLTQGPQFSRAPVGENCPSNAVLTPKKTLTQDVVRCACATDSHACTHQHARRGSVVLLFVVCLLFQTRAKRGDVCGHTSLNATPVQDSLMASHPVDPATLLCLTQGKKLLNSNAQTASK